MRDTFLGFTVHCHHKGGNSQNEMNQANQLSQQQQQIMQQQLGLQQQQLGMVNPTLQKIISNGGMLPSEQAALTAQAINTVPQQYNQLVGQLNNQLVQRGVTGGQNAGGGQIAQQFGALGAAEAGQQQQLMSNIQLQKAQGLQGALNTAIGIGGQYGQQALGFGQQGVGALGIGQQAAAQADQNQTGFWGALTGGLAGLGSSVINQNPGGIFGV